jgi:selenocysteine lyase/cysteine desulfurase
LNFTEVGTHVEKLTQRLKEKLSLLRHSNGAPVIRIYGERQSSIVSFNALDDKGAIVPYETVVEEAANRDIYLVGGCHGTPGTCRAELEASEEDVRTAGVGAVRASLGWSTVESDIDALIECLRLVFVK